MQLETIHFGTPRADRPSILLIHGAYCGAWVWQTHFIPFLEAQGWHGVALSLRGHGKSEGLAMLDLYGIQDFTEDALKIARTFDMPPIVIGHSMGGVISQLLSSRISLSAQVLLVSVPPGGMANATQQLWFEKPLLASQMSMAMSLGGMGVSSDMMFDSMFATDTPSAVKKPFLHQFQKESTRAAFEILMPQIYFTPDPVPPTLVLGGDHDPFIPVCELIQTARFWEAHYQIIPNLPHAMMLDPCWHSVAEPIVKWLDDLF